MTREATESLAFRISQVVLPREHGGWSLVLEPLALGFIVAPSAAGAGLGVAVVAGFFLRRPLKLVLGAGPDPRRPVAIGTIAVLGATAVAGLLLASARAGIASFWPLLFAVPAGTAFVWWDSRGGGRDAAAELAGATAFAAVPAALATAAGWSPGSALALTAVMAGRSLPTVMTIRAYLRREKNQPVSILPALVASGAGVAVSFLLVSRRLAPWTAALLAGLLLVRAVVLLLPTHPRVRASRLGLMEAIGGGALVIVLALSWPH